MKRCDLDLTELWNSLEVVFWHLLKELHRLAVEVQGLPKISVRIFGVCVNFIVGAVLFRKIMFSTRSAVLCGLVRPILT